MYCNKESRSSLQRHVYLKESSNPIFWIRNLLFPCELCTSSKIFLDFMIHTDNYKKFRKDKFSLGSDPEKRNTEEKKQRWKTQGYFSVENCGTRYDEIVETYTGTYNEFILLM